MNTFFLKRTLPALGLLGLAACQPDIDEPKVDRGSADFTKYVSVGNSLTAGYQSGGLFLEGQQNSYPSILAKQFAKAGGGEFVQPLFADNQKDGAGYLNLVGFTNTGSPILLTPGQSVTVTPAGESAPRVVTNPKTYQLAYTGNKLPAPPLGSGLNELAPYTGPLPNNLAVPGMSVLSADATASTTPLVAGSARAYGNINNYYQRLLPVADRGTKDYLTYISQATPTFFTCWLGSMDVQTYATAGGVVDPNNPFSNLTDTTSFGRGYRNIVKTLTKNGTVKGVVANIPNVTNLPYFTAVPVASIIASIKANPSIPNAASASLYIRTGTGTTASIREAKSTDYLVLPASSIIGTPSTTPGNPLPVGVGYSATQNNALLSQYVLGETEVAAIVTRTNQLNGIIAKTARQYNVALADMNGFFGSVALNGLATNAVANNASFIRGNLFSLDGVHPSSRGYAVIANEFIRVINQSYGASVPFVNPNEYSGVLLP